MEENPNGKVLRENRTNKCIEEEGDNVATFRDVSTFSRLD